MLFSTGFPRRRMFDFPVCFELVEKSAGFMAMMPWLFGAFFIKNPPKQSTDLFKRLCLKTTGLFFAEML